MQIQVSYSIYISSSFSTLIHLRCPNSGFSSSLKINSGVNDTKSFEWQDIAFRYYGDSNTVRIVCDLVVCPVREFSNTSEQCKRCNNKGGRRRRDVTSEGGYKVSTVRVETAQFYLVEGTFNQGNIYGVLCIIKLLDNNFRNKYATYSYYCYSWKLLKTLCSFTENSWKTFRKTFETFPELQETLRNYTENSL